MWTKGRIYHNALRWFSDALQGLGSNLRRRTTNAMIGSVGNLVRTVCIIGCIFELYTSFWELHSACYSTIPDQFVRIAYAGFKFALTCIETAAIGLGIGAEILGHVTLAAVCGYVGIAIALVGIVAGIAYITWGPQPDTPVEKFLNDHLRDIGGYLPEAEPEPVKEWLEDLWKELKKPAQFPLGN
ncbi:uncharacterized protein TRIVIDRAFT_216139 [Trichoderma virens Gv29-8]|uniref:Uncharacterized protein n=1 Tax=Hypocrea virens (strain Gv29-8 / FGSC 10586) TaxID=413071 RepID=G9MTV9_HYPVG|nr:uncharacterized protein TRIVIDRAFT_216139 [Trichoderma virens Gv29-8]EHK22120.1 hypothetical protein TRIVIDRAFT_216139 [Trichoderma virens Gv29-8]